MIGLETLKNKIQSLLNDVAGSSQLEFVLAMDTGDFQKALKDQYNNYDTAFVNGIVSVTDSKVTPTQGGLKISSVTVRAEVVVPLTRNQRARTDRTYAGTDLNTTVEGYEQHLDLIRGIINEVCSQPIVYPETVTGESDYNVAATFAFTVTGTRQRRPQVGDSMTFIFYAYFDIIQGGDNSREYKFFIDGQEVPYIRANITREQTIETDQYSDDRAAKATSTGGLFQVSFNFPSFISKYSNAIKDFLINGDSNTVHILRVLAGHTFATPNTATEFVKVVFIKGVDESVEGTMNAGVTASLVEAPNDYEIMTVPSTLGVTRLEAVTESNYYLKFDKPVDGFYVDTYDYQIEKFTTTPIKSGGNTFYYTSFAVLCRESSDSYKTYVVYAPSDATVTKAVSIPAET